MKRRFPDEKKIHDRANRSQDSIEPQKKKYQFKLDTVNPIEEQVFSFLYQEPKKKLR
jgi:hypothetical protein